MCSTCGTRVAEVNGMPRASGEPARTTIEESQIVNTLRSRVAAIGIATLTAVALSACMQEAAPTSQVDAEAQLCTSLAAFGTALGGLRDLDVTTSSAEDVRPPVMRSRWRGTRSRRMPPPSLRRTRPPSRSHGRRSSAAVDNIATDVPIEEALVPVQEAWTVCRPTSMRCATGSAASRPSVPRTPTRTRSRTG